MPINNEKEKYISEFYEHINTEPGDLSQGFDSLNRILDNTYENISSLTSDLLLEKSRSILSLIRSNTQRKIIKNHPFFLFLPSIDVSMSILEKADQNNQEKIIKHALLTYIRFRYTYYNNNEAMRNLGILALDRGSSRKNGEAAKRKVESIAQENGWRRVSSQQLADFSDNEFAFADGRDKALYTNLVQSSPLSAAKKNALLQKKPDFIFKKGNMIILIEHKHLKESGGAQDKQMVEVMNFIEKGNEIGANIQSYGFIDGVYYNKLLIADSKLNDGSWNSSQNKTTNIITKAREIEIEKGYYPILNTAAFIDLISS